MPLAFQVATLQTKPPKEGENGYAGFNPRKEILPKGWKSREDARPLSEDLIVEHDVAFKVRDGCTLYGDVYRPVNSDSETVPAIVAWSPFGKKHNGIEMMSKVRRSNQVRRFETDIAGQMGLWCSQGVSQWFGAVRGPRSCRILPTRFCHRQRRFTRRGRLRRVHCHYGQTRGGRWPRCDRGARQIRVV